jgi:hypothetical protein
VAVDLIRSSFRTALPKPLSGKILIQRFPDLCAHQDVLIGEMPRDSGDLL